jgi:DNA-binding transcriptional LysR family regulator
MASLRERRVPKKEPARTAVQEMPDWDTARVFLQIARKGSIRAAAVAFDQSVNAVRRKVDQLETSLGVTLFTRHVDGMRLTEEGQRIFEAAQRMETAAFDIVRGSQAADSGISGDIKLAVTEGLGTFWLAPRLVEFRKLYPDVSVSLDCTMSKVDVLRLEADVAIQLERPVQKDLRVVKLGRMHLLPFASGSYAKLHGLPKSEADLAHHPILVQEAEQIAPLEEYTKHIGAGQVPLGPVVIKSNLSGTHYFGVASGAGIGLLPTYCVALGAPIVPLDLPYNVHHDIWLAYHHDAGRIPRVRKLIEWLIEAFSPRRFPWFADKLIHPKAFPRNLSGVPPLDAYKPFVG